MEEPEAKMQETSKAGTPSSSSHHHHHHHHHQQQQHHHTHNPSEYETTLRNHVFWGVIFCTLEWPTWPRSGGASPKDDIKKNHSINKSLVHLKNLQS